MANRYGRDIGRRGRERSGSEGGYGGVNRTSAYGDEQWREDESYFGGSRQFGSGNSSGSGGDHDRYDRGYGRTAIPDSGSEYLERTRRDNDYSLGPGSESKGRYSGPRPTDYRNYGSDYPSSERGYMRDYENGRDERGWWDKTSDEVASWFGDDEAASRRQQDMRSGGGHRGRGPSGYVRSDDRIREDINDRLTDYDYLDATNISVEVKGCEVTLTGTVDSRYAKRVAEDIADDVSGVKNVENRLRVNAGSSTSAGTEATYSATSGTTASGAQAKGKSSGT